MSGTTAQTCEKCGEMPGRPYSFLYGTVDSSTELQGGFSRTTSREQISGEETVLICERCIRAHQRRGIVNGAIAVVVSIAAIAVAVALLLSAPLEGDADLQPQQLVALFVVLAGLLGVLLSLIWVNAHRGQVTTELGERVALLYRRKALEKQGFGGTWTHQGWRNHIRSQTS